MSSTRWGRSPPSSARGTGRMVHVKPHGALYNQAVADPKLSAALARAVARADRDLVFVGLATSNTMREAAEAEGLCFAGEAFADRVYNPDGTLQSRRIAGSVIHDPAKAAAQAVAIASGSVIAHDGTEVPVAAETLCLHGDNPAALDNARTVRRRLEAAGVAGPRAGLTLPPPEPSSLSGRGEPRLRNAGEAAFSVEFGNEISRELNARATGLAALLEREPFEGYREAIPTFRSVLVSHDPEADPDAIRAHALDLARRAGSEPEPPSRRIEIPCVYDGEDLPEVAEQVGVSVEELIQVHAGRDYRVYIIGFTPGFPYLGWPIRASTSRGAPSPGCGSRRARLRWRAPRPASTPGSRPAAGTSSAGWTRPPLRSREKPAGRVRAGGPGAFPAGRPVTGTPGGWHCRHSAPRGTAGLRGRARGAPDHGPGPRAPGIPALRGSLVGSGRPRLAHPREPGRREPGWRRRVRMHPDGSGAPLPPAGR